MQHNSNGNNLEFVVLTLQYCLETFEQNCQCGRCDPCRKGQDDIKRALRIVEDHALATVSKRRKAEELDVNGSQLNEAAGALLEVSRFHPTCRIGRLLVGAARGASPTDFAWLHNVSDDVLALRIRRFHSSEPQQSDGSSAESVAKEIQTFCSRRPDTRVGYLTHEIVRVHGASSMDWLSSLENGNLAKLIRDFSSSVV